MVVSASLRERLIGRDAELERIARFLDAVPKGPAALVLEGEAGIGKTALWNAGLEEAVGRGHFILSSCPAAAEARLAFAALGDLLAEVRAEAFGSLPEPQAEALNVALLRARANGRGPDWRAVAVAVLGVLRAEAVTGPVLVAADDVQWLDASSARILEFVFRRLRDEPIGIMLTRRVEGEAPRPLGLDRSLSGERLESLRVGPLTPAAVHYLIRSRLGPSLARPTLMRLHQTSGGNPFFALELARALQSAGLETSPAEPLPTTRVLRRLVEERLGRLSARARHVLLVASALAHPTTQLVQTAVGRLETTAHDLDRAVRAGLIELEGDRIRFTHPLLASIHYSGTPISKRREVHRRIAAVVSHPEERARHLALAAGEADPAVAAALEDAAGRVSARGAPQVAAELCELAIKLTPAPSGDDVRRRRRQAADYHFSAGEMGRARRLLEGLLKELPPGGERADVLLRLATTREDDFEVGIALLEEARNSASGDARRLAAVDSFMAQARFVRGDLRAALHHARAALDQAEHAQDPELLLLDLSQVAAMETWAGTITQGLLERGLGLEERLAGSARYSPIVYRTPSAVLGLRLMYEGRLDAARQRLEAAEARAEEHGDDLSRAAFRLYLTELECRAGRWDAAAEHAAMGLQVADEMGLDHLRSALLYVTALVAAHRGSVEDARQAALECGALAQNTKEGVFGVQSQAVLGFLELSIGNPAGAASLLEPLPNVLEGVGYGEPSIYRMVLPNLVEALVGVGDLEGAARFQRRFETLSRRLDRGWALAMAHRCRAMIQAAQGDSQSALGSIDQALVEHETCAEPFELGRTMLVRGQIERRLKRKRAAKESLARALGAFEELGAPLWAKKARAELGRIGLRSASPFELTPTELVVAERVATGSSNRDVAHALFMSENTVEDNLKRVYRKLGVHSRAELARVLQEAPAQPASS